MPIRLTSMPLVTRIAVTLALALVGASASGALGDQSCLEYHAVAGGFPLVSEGRAADLQVDAQDHAGVRRAVGDLQADIARVTGVTPALTRAAGAAGASTVIIGTIGRSQAIDRLIQEHKIDVSPIAGKWEAFLTQVVDAPAPGIDRALVIAGSDKRGTIYGIYELSQQIGVSPWYWWADVPVKRQPALFVRPGRVVETGPVVKYRGIFLNDEAPALTGWVKEKFGGFNHQFYAHVFELILRLRGNYLWPAMWKPQAFNDDDPENARLADEYGIVMGTSHHEPLMRAHAEWDKYGSGPWDYAKNDAVLREFWRGSVERTKKFENIQSLGMRGDGDEAMSAETNTALLERIVADQRKIIADVTGKPLTATPQLWALYKEVQGYYEHGMRVPDDVTLLWCDDNWGNIRRLPTPEERARPGGAGVYYHFDYVGGPRNYKWLNTVPLTKIQEQMNLAWQHDANRIWIVNVGDLKPMEFPIEFFLTMAWNPARWPADRLKEYSEQWAARQFGPEHATEVAAFINGYTKLNGRRKPEQLAPDTFSLVNYREAERVLVEWNDLLVEAEAINAALAPEYRDAFFQLVLYPVKASAGVQELYIATGLNRLYARQGRVDANVQSARVRELFAADRKLADQYHQLGAGKWNHQMDQVKFGYTYWQQPDVETMPAVQEVLPRSGPSMGVAIESNETPFPSYGARQAVLPELASFEDGVNRWIEVFNRGDTPFDFKAKADQPWVSVYRFTGNWRTGHYGISQNLDSAVTRVDGKFVHPPINVYAGGNVAKETVRLLVSVDWERAPVGRSTAMITIDGAAAGKTVVQLPVYKPTEPMTGFVELDKNIAIEAPLFTRAVTAGGIEWKVLPDFGRTLGGVTAFPVTAPEIKPGGDSPRLEYDVHLFSAGEVTVELHCAPSLDFQSGAGLRLAVSFDDAPPQIVKLDTWATLQTWERAVSDGVRRVTTKHLIAQPGRHVLKYWLVTPGVVLERLIIDAGGMRPSYLGPPESPQGRQP